jgi:hypothetical protein
MNPNDPGQAPGGGTPPVWGPPPAPDQPGYGAPPPAPQAPYGAPPAPYGAPPAPYGAPPPAWGAPVPAQSKGGIGKKILLGVGVVIVALVAISVAVALLVPSHAGHVIFTTDAPTASGASTCDLGNQVTTVTAGTPVYANFFYKERLTNETVTLTITKNGSVLDTSTLTSDQSNGVDCVESSANLGDLGPGVYEFKLTTSKGDVVSDGTLTIK